MKVAVIGSRDYQNIRKIKDTLFQLKQKFGDKLIIISGGAKHGADKFVRKIVIPSNKDAKNIGTYSSNVEAF